MQGKFLVIGLVSLFIGLITLYVYFQNRVLVGIGPMGDNATTIALLFLAAALVSLLTSLISHINCVMEIRAIREYR